MALFSLTISTKQIPPSILWLFNEKFYKSSPTFFYQSFLFHPINPIVEIESCKLQLSISEHTMETNTFNSWNITKALITVDASLQAANLNTIGVNISHATFAVHAIILRLGYHVDIIQLASALSCSSRELSVNIHTNLSPPTISTHCGFQSRTIKSGLHTPHRMIFSDWCC